MKSKIVVLFLIIIIGASVNLSATPYRLGIAAGFPNIVGNFRTGRFDFKGGYDFSKEERSYVFLSSDLRLVNLRPIAQPFHFSFGIGGFGKLVITESNNENDVTLEYGLRLPASFSLLLLDNFLELYMEISPGLDFYPVFTISDKEPVQVWVGFTFELD